MKNGFTLVELLAVIVILAVLALIATPVVLSIIDDAKESSMLRSAEMYLSGVENAVMRENMNSGGNFRPNECTITNGNMTCDTTSVEVEVDGEVPSTGSIKFENGKITEVTLNYESGTIIKDSSGSLVYDELESVLETKILGGVKNSEGVMIYTWQELIEGDYITVEGTTLKAGTNALAFGYYFVVDSSITKIQDVTTNWDYEGYEFIEYVIIPKSVESISGGFPVPIFGIFYEGSKEEWETMSGIEATDSSWEFIFNYSEEE